jgi:coenzyme F420-reducing hydrogenase delta subunit
MSSFDNNKGPVLAFFCNWAPYRCLMDLGKSGRSLPPPIRPIKVMCSGRLDPSIILYAFEKGAEGVMVIGCKDKECRYGPGPQQTEKMAERMAGLMGVLGLEPERFSTRNYAPPDTDRLFADMNSFVSSISQLGRSPLALHPHPRIKYGASSDPPKSRGTEKSSGRSSSPSPGGRGPEGEG